MKVSGLDAATERMTGAKVTPGALDAAVAYADRQGLRAIVDNDALSRVDERAFVKRAFSDGTLRRLY